MVKSTASSRAAKTQSRKSMSGGRVAKRDIKQLMNAYPLIYFACHTQHVRDPDTQEEISRHQASILDHLDPVEGTSLLQLAEHMGVTASTMSLNVDRLERRGYVTRERDTADRRRVLLRLTPSGTKVTQAQSVLDPRRVKLLLAELSPTQRGTALAGLRILAEAGQVAMRKKSKQKGDRRAARPAGNPANN